MACKCRPRNIWIINYMCHYSAFSGGRKTWSDYSLVQCLYCGETWRTKAAYVDDKDFPLAPENWVNMNQEERLAWKKKWAPGVKQ